MNAAGLRRIAGNVKTGYAGHVGKCAFELQIGSRRTIHYSPVPPAFGRILGKTASSPQKRQHWSKTSCVNSYSKTHQIDFYGRFRINTSSTRGRKNVNKLLRLLPIFKQQSIICIHNSEIWHHRTFLLLKMNELPYDVF